MLRIGLISYTHNDPLLYYFKKKRHDNIKVVRNNPKVLADLLLRGELDIAQVSLAKLARHYNLTVVPATAVHCQGPSLSSIVASKSKVKLDSNSIINISSETETSSLLLRWILRRKGIANRMIECEAGNAESLLARSDYALLIGDEALKVKLAGINVIFDIGDEWYRSTKKPCIFAVSAIKKTKIVSPEIIEGVHILRQAVSFANDNIETISSLASSERRLDAVSLINYFSSLQLDFDQDMENSIKYELSQILEDGYEVNFLDKRLMDRNSK